MITNLEKTRLLGKTVDSSYDNSADEHYQIVVHEVSESFVTLRKETFDASGDEDFPSYEDTKMYWEKFLEEFSAY